MSTRGTTMWRTSRCISRNTFSVISYSRSEIWPARADRERMLRTSSAVCVCSWPGSTGSPASRSNAFDIPLIAVMKGPKSQVKTRSTNAVRSGGPLGAPQRPHLRGLLPHGHVQRRDHGEGQRDGDEREPRRVGVDIDADAIGGGDQEHRDRGLAERSEDQARQRDAELTGGEVPVQILQDVLQDARGANVLLGEGVDARGAHLDQRELRGHEESVQEHEEERRAEAPGDAEGIEVRVDGLHSGAAPAPASRAT